MKTALDYVKNFFLNRRGEQYYNTSGNNLISNSNSFTLMDSGVWKDIFGSNDLDSIFKYYRSFAYSCINARAENVAKANIYLFEKVGKKIKERLFHPFLDLIENPNMYGQTFRDLIYLTIVHLDLFGNAYAYIVRNRLKMPEEIILLNPERVKIVFNKDLSDFVYKYSDKGKEIIYTSDEIIHFKLPNPVNNFKGKATISALADTLMSDLYQSRYQSNFYRNDARPGFFLETEKKLNFLPT